MSEEKKTTVKVTVEPTEKEGTSKLLYYFKSDERIVESTASSTFTEVEDRLKEQGPLLSVIFLDKNSSMFDMVYANLMNSAYEPNKSHDTGSFLLSKTEENYYQLAIVDNSYRGKEITSIAGINTIKTIFTYALETSLKEIQKDTGKKNDFLKSILIISGGKLRGMSKLLISTVYEIISRTGKLSLNNVNLYLCRFTPNSSQSYEMSPLYGEREKEKKKGKDKKKKKNKKK